MELPGSTNSMVSLVCLMHAEEGQDRDNHDDQPNQINKTAHFEFSLRKARDAAGTTRRSEISSARPTPRASALPDCACHAQFAVSKNAFPHKGIVRESRFLTDKLPSSACLRSRLGIALKRRHGGGGTTAVVRIVRSWHGLFTCHQSRFVTSLNVPKDLSASIQNVAMRRPPITSVG